MRWLQERASRGTRGRSTSEQPGGASNLAELARTWALAAIAGVMIGSLFGQGLSWAQLSTQWGWVRELAAPWAVAAFLAGCVTSVTVASAAAGWLCISAATISFYGLLTIPPQLWPSAGPWPMLLLVAAVLVGPAMGALGAAWHRGARSWLAGGAAAGLLAGEGVALAWHTPNAGFPARVFLLEAALGLALATALARTPRRLGHALAAVLAITAFVVAAEAGTGVVTTLFVH